MRNHLQEIVEKSKKTYLRVYLEKQGLNWTEWVKDKHSKPTTAPKPKNMTSTPNVGSKNTLSKTISTNSTKTDVAPTMKNLPMAAEQTKPTDKAINGTVESSVLRTNTSLESSPSSKNLTASPNAR